MFFDTHADIWTDILHHREKGVRGRLREFHVPRMQQGGMGGGIFVVWIDPPHDAHPQKRLLQAIRSLFAELHESGDLVKMVRCHADFAEAEKEKKLAVVAGLEGLSGIGDSVEWLYALHALGFRHASLTWNEENPLAAGARGAAGQGLTSAGKEALAIMEALGMLVDLSHANTKTFWDILDNTSKTLIASHSNCKSLCNNRRNLDDDQLLAIAERGGVVGVVAYGPFISNFREKMTIQGLADHVDHLAELVGVEHIGFGFDFGDYLNPQTISHFQEGDVYGPQGLQSVVEVPAFLAELQARGYTARELELMCSQNMLRVFKQTLGEAS